MRRPSQLTWLLDAGTQVIQCTNKSTLFCLRQDGDRHPWEILTTGRPHHEREVPSRPLRLPHPSERRDMYRLTSEAPEVILGVRVWRKACDDD